MMKVSSILSAMGLVSVLLLTGCGDNGAAQDTAEAVMEAVINDMNKSSVEKALLAQQPEWKSIMQCIVTQLEYSGWTQDQHDFFMKESQQSGSLDQINLRKFSEADQMKHFAPLTMATGSCV